MILDGKSPGGRGIVQIEVLASGLPVAAYDTPGPRDVARVFRRHAAELLA